MPALTDGKPVWGLGFESRVKWTVFLQNQPSSVLAVAQHMAFPNSGRGKTSWLVQHVHSDFSSHFRKRFQKRASRTKRSELNSCKKILTVAEVTCTSKIIPQSQWWEKGKVSAGERASVRYTEPWHKNLLQIGSEFGGVIDDWFIYQRNSSPNGGEMIFY